MRVDDRRWDLRLKDGALIQLPAVGEEAALIQLEQLDQRSRILELGFERIDLRDPDDGGRAAARRSAAPPRRPARRPTARERRTWPSMLRTGDAAPARTDAKDGRDGLKAALAPPAGGGRRGPGRLQGRLLHHEARRRAPRRPHPDQLPASAMSSRAACAAARSSTWTRPSEAIAQAVERAENVAGVNVQGVTVATAGGQLASHRVSRPGLPRRPADLRQRPGRAPSSRRWPRSSCPGRRAIHILPIAWSVDGQGGVRDPRAMFGRTLGVELLVVSVAETVFHTLGACVERAHLQFEGVVAAPFVSALAALEEDEMDLGARLHRHGRRLDLGGGVLRRQPGARREPCRSAAST